MRRVLVLSVVLGLLLALPGIAGAARPDRFTDERWSLQCGALEATDGSVLFLAAEISREFGAFGFLAIWAAGTEPFLEDPTAISGDSGAAVSGLELTATFAMWEYDPSSDPPLGASLGTAELLATLTAVGDPEMFEFSFKEGNRLLRGSGTRQVYSVAGELTLPGGATADLSVCSVEHVEETFFGTNPARDPASFIFRSEGVQLSCSWSVDAGFVSLFASTDASGTFSDLFIETEGSFISGFTESGTLTTTEYAASFDLVSEEAGAVVGSAEATAQLTATGDRLRINDRFPDGSFKLIGELLSVAGTTVIDLGGDPLELTMNDESCQAFDGRTTSHFVDPRGPKGRSLANDTPAGAIPLGIGQSDRVVTGGNAPEPEASCTGEDEFGEPFEFPIEYTAWWSFTGTGEEVTVSTAGSDFDTIVGVYQVVGDELVQVACVDDVFDPEFSLQATVTIATEAGATYLIQAGGYAGSTGRLEVSLS